MAWVCDVLLSEHSVRAYGRDLAHFAQHMHTLGVDPLSVLRGAYRQFAEKGLIEWETTENISSGKANSFSGSGGAK